MLIQGWEPDIEGYLASGLGRYFKAYPFLILPPDNGWGKRRPKALLGPFSVWQPRQRGQRRKAALSGAGV